MVLIFGKTRAYFGFLHLKWDILIWNRFLVIRSCQYLPRYLFMLNSLSSLRLFMDMIYNYKLGQQWPVLYIWNVQAFKHHLGHLTNQILVDICIIINFDLMPKNYSWSNWWKWKMYQIKTLLKYRVKLFCIVFLKLNLILLFTYSLFSISPLQLVVWFSFYK